MSRTDQIARAWACGVHQPEDVGVVCGACHEAVMARARADARTEERTRIVARLREWAKELGAHRNPHAGDALRAAAKTIEEDQP